MDWHFTEITLNGFGEAALRRTSLPPVRLGLTARLANFPWTSAPRAQQLKMHMSFRREFARHFQVREKVNKKSGAKLSHALRVRSDLRIRMRGFIG